MFGILIVEDEELERQALRRILDENLEGVRILGEARTGPEAVQLIDSCAPDLLLVDINIPGLNGLEVIRHLRGRHLDTKVIITTAYDFFEITRTAIHLKADEYLLKPIRTEILVDTVRDCLRQLDATRRFRELSGRIQALVEQGAYPETAALVRQQVAWIFGQRDSAPRDLAMAFAAAMVQLAGSQGPGLAQQATQLRSLAFDPAGQEPVLAVFQAMVDRLFPMAGAGSGAGSADPVRRALTYIERNLKKGVTLEEVADHLAISPCYFSRLFKKTMDVNFIRYLTNRRMECAKELLAGTALPISRIALEMSCSDVNYFCKSFKKEVGLSPTGFRQRARPAPDRIPPA
jgi:YesN/AraC family two-component response regulator